MSVLSQFVHLFENRGWEKKHSFRLDLIRNDKKVIKSTNQ